MQEIAVSVVCGVVGVVDELVAINTQKDFMYLFVFRSRIMRIGRYNQFDLIFLRQCNKLVMDQFFIRKMMPLKFNKEIILSKDADKTFHNLAGKFHAAVQYCS